MGLHNSREIMNQLLESGCEPQRSVAVIQAATRPSQKSMWGLFKTISDLADQGKFQSPTVIVWEVVRLGRELQWLSETEFDYQLGMIKVRENSAEFRI
jgi:siroheme synthase